MIKLVSQFDDEKTRVSLATPTCGGCCCCCCCLISTTAISCISARSFGKLAKKTYPNDKNKIMSAKKIGALWPIFGLIYPIVSLPVFEKLMSYISPLLENVADGDWLRYNICYNYIISNNWYSNTT